MKNAATKTYAAWMQNYSGEDQDRASRLASALSPAGSIGYTKEAYARAAKIVDAANEYSRGFAGPVTY